MKKTKKTSTMSLFATAVLTCETVIQKYKKTKVAYWAERFKEINIPLSKEYNKGVEKIKRPLLAELRDCKTDNALMKNDLFVYVKDKEGKDTSEYEPLDREARKKIDAKSEEISAAIADQLEEYLNTEVQMNIFTGSCDLPAEMTSSEEAALNGFIFTNKSEFYEDITEEEKE